ncbi:MAG: sulfite exporter TauE/SafE family protein [Candidatus Omnitrophota bacterium]
MTAKILWSLFITGFVLGYGPCLLSCGPLLISYISATQPGPKQGLKFYLIFSLTRILVYGVLGILAGFFGQWVIQNFFESQWLKWAFGAFGFFLIILGLALLLQKLPSHDSCHGWLGRYLKGGEHHAVLFSLLVSLSPCLPLLGVLGYVALVSDTWIKGLVFMSAFGLGTSISPLIIFCAAAGWLARLSRRFEFWFLILRVLCCGILVFLGLQLLSVLYP